jgi:hypothetical protein
VHDVSAVCAGCGRVADLDLPRLIAASFGNVPLIRRPLRCSGMRQTWALDQPF